MDEEDVARESLAARRAAEKKRDLAVGLGVLREVVVDDEHVATRFHEMLGDARRGVRRDVGESWRFVALRDDHDRVLQRAVFPGR